MAEIDPSLVRTLDAVVETQVKAQTLGMDIDADRLRYSNWVMAIAAAGIAFTANAQAHFAGGNLHSLCRYGPMTAVLLLSLCLVIGGALHWGIGQEAIRHRSRVIMYLKQKTRILAGLVIVVNRDQLFSDLLSGAYLDTVDRKILMRSNVPALSDRWAVRFLLAQVLTVATAYMLLGLCSIQ